ncbi:MAG: hypothetical protein KGH57_04150 [Candidatus Micrarchaeota archaeon]|nr:hypothetical protein [Candidatus Micrarchaeota archaeon]
MVLPQLFPDDDPWKKFGVEFVKKRGTQKTADDKDEWERFGVENLRGPAPRAGVKEKFDMIESTVTEKSRSNYTSAEGQEEMVKSKTGLFMKKVREAVRGGGDAKTQMEVLSYILRQVEDRPVLDVDKELNHMIQHAREIKAASVQKRKI